MTSEEIANHLINLSPQSDLNTTLDHFHPQLSFNVLKHLDNFVYTELLRNAQRALVVANTAVAVAHRLGTGQARGMALWTQGNANYALNKYADSLACFQQAEQYFQQIDDSLAVVGLQINQVAILRDLGDYKQAIAQAQKAQSACEAIGEKAENYQANLDRTIGWVYEEMGDFATALATYEHARDIYLKHNKPEQAALLDVNKAHLLQTMNQFVAADVLLRAARKTLAEVQYDQEVARVDLNLGILAFHRGQYQLALRYLEAAHAGFTAVSLPIEVANVNMYRALVYRQLNLIQEMLALASEAGQLFHNNKMRREYARCLILQAVGYQRLGHLETAEQFLARARRQLYRQGAWGRLLLLDANRAELALMTQRPYTARRIAFRVLQKTTAAEQPALVVRLQLVLARGALALKAPDWKQAQQRAMQAVDIAHTYHLTELKVQAHTLLGEIKERQGELQAAEQQYQKAIQQCELLKSFLSLDEFHVSYLDDKLPVYEDYLGLTHQVVQAQSRSLVHLLPILNLVQTVPFVHSAQALGTPAEAADAELEAELQAERQAWHWYQNRLAAGDGNVNVAQVREQIVGAEARISELTRRIRVRRLPTPTGADVRHELPAFDFLRALQAKLKPGEMVLQLYLANGPVQALLLSQLDVQVVPDLVPVQTLERQLNSWRFYVQRVHTAQGGKAVNPRLAQSHLGRLYQALLAPLRAALADCSHLFLVLPPAWHKLPVAALFDGTDYLINRHQITHLSALDVILNRGESLAEAVSERPQAYVFGYSSNGRLPHTIGEAEAVARTLAPTWQTSTALETAVTKSALAAAAPQARLLHLATHATFRPDNPYFSWIELSDSRFTVADLYQLRLPQRPLVVLSACETGRGTPRGGGLLGMGRGFLAAGASGLLLTDWAIDDEASAQLMQRFYERLSGTAVSAAPESVAHALQTAQLEAIALGQSPFYWAGFKYIAG